MCCIRDSWRETLGGTNPGQRAARPPRNVDNNSIKPVMLRDNSPQRRIPQEAVERVLAYAKILTVLIECVANMAGITAHYALHITA